MKKQLICFVIFLLLLAAALSVVHIRANKRFENKTANIYQNGNLIKTISLDEIEKPIEFTITGTTGCVNIIRADKGRICMQDADCPDKICVNTGWIDNCAIPIVCLPNKIIIEITDSKNNFDVRTGG